MDAALHRTPKRSEINKVRRRLVFEEIQPVQSSKIVCKDNKREQYKAPMAEAFVEKNCSEYVVFFLGYRHPHHCAQTYYCSRCIDDAVGYQIKEEDERHYITTGEKSLIQFTDEDHQSKSNYCVTCLTPLYEIKVNEQCQHSRPTSNKWLQRFHKRRHYGLRGGGFSQ